MKINRIIIIVFCTLVLLSCTEEISLNTKFEPQIAIFGNFSNDIEHVNIDISSTVSLSTTTTNPINNAKVSFFTKDQSGKASLVTNHFTVSKGKYESVDPVTPIIGNYYWIEVESENGARYKSGEEILKNPVPITDITKDGGVYKVEFSDSKNTTDFYLGIFELYDEDGAFITDELVTTNDALFNGNEKAFLETTIEIFGIKEVRVILFNLSYDTYRFYLNLSLQGDNTSSSADTGDPGQLFMPPPIGLEGNIINTKTNGRALGNFGVITGVEAISFFR